MEAAHLLTESNSSLLRLHILGLDRSTISASRRLVLKQQHWQQYRSITP